jgi:hypothetical protein
MPEPAETLARVSAIANDMIPIALVWHALLFAASLSLLAGWRPTCRTSTRLLVAPLASVAWFAFAYGVPFNGAVFTIATLWLLWSSRSVPRQPVAMSARVPAAVGLGLLAVAWGYPHFLAGRAPFVYLYGAPLGLIPCPTLIALIGFALVAGGFGSTRWSMSLAVLGAFYGITGVAWLGVWLDAALVVGAAALGALAVTSRDQNHGRRTRTARAVQAQHAR